MNSGSDLLVEVVQGVASVTLNRPQALNALTHEMCIELLGLLRGWASDSAVRAVVVRGAGERAFCAGGDIRKLYEEGRRGGDYPFRFYSDEYRLDAAVHHFPKPYVALLDGIVMGGGVGVSIHGSHRVVTENTLFAMPETGIGLFPDVGGTYFLPRCPGQLGMYLGLTGARLRAADMLYAGLADAFIPTARLADLEGALRAGGAAASQVVAAFAAATGEPSLAGQREAIDRCFAGESVEEILARLATEGSEWASKTAATLSSKSPTSLKVTHHQLRAGRTMDFDECMRLEWRMVNRIVAGHDFYEGTRAAVIDKDQAPQWRPADLAAVSEADVAVYFSPLPTGDLELGTPGEVMN